MDAVAVVGGEAEIQCGQAIGAACGFVTRLEFPACTDAINSYIDSSVHPPDPVKSTDAAVLALVNNMAPPSGTTWLIGCVGPPGSPTSMP